MKISSTSVVLLVIGIFLIGFLAYRSLNSFAIPSGETVPLSDIEVNTEEEDVMVEKIKEGDASPAQKLTVRPKSDRQIFVTDGVKHSIPLDEILAGGPPKDGIPSIDEPKFLNRKDADREFADDEIGLGFIGTKSEARFYPYQVLVWHEIVNDVVDGEPVLVTYCPLCATGVVFDRKVEGKEQEFGVSGRLWQSNLLMYNRAPNPDDESLWSQVLGEAVLGVNTGERLGILRSDTVRYGDWKKKYPDTKVLSTETGFSRRYGDDPYEGYYTSEEVSFGATFTDTRLHPKAYVLGVEIDGAYKAYDVDALPLGVTMDTFAGETITIEKSDIGEVTMTRDGGSSLPYIGGFWFSWLAVHPDSELFN